MKKGAAALIFLLSGGLLAAQGPRSIAELQAELNGLIAKTIGPRPALPSLAPGVVWAYPVPDVNPPLADLPESFSIAGSSKVYRRVDLFSPFVTLDWFPDAHAPMPPVVSEGRPGATPACVLCHSTSGVGHPSSANLTGLPASYLMRQLADFKSGARRNWPMGPIAAQISDDEARQAVAWFTSLKPRPVMRVVEATAVPASFATAAMRFVVPGRPMEPLGDRILELPVDEMPARMRDPRTSFVAYVPPGALKIGEALVQTGGGKSLACSVCHGPDLRGVGEIPRIAGLAPSYTVRQLYAIQTGARAGGMNELMKPVVANLTPADMLAIAAYVASKEP